MTEKLQETVQQPGRIPVWVKRVVPIIVSAAILYYYFHDKDWQVLWEATARATLWLAILAIVAPQLVHWYFHTLLVQQHFEWFHGPFPLWDYFWVRGAMYILMFVNPVLGGGGVLLYTQRKAKITWTKLWGIILFRIGLMLWGFSVFMIPITLAMHYYGYTEQAGINMYVWWGFLIFGVVYLINGWMTWHHGTHFGISKFVVRDRNSEFWTAFRMASKKQWYFTWALGIPPAIFSLVALYFLNIAFDINVPFVQFIVVAPLAMAIMDLPIAFGGFGTATLAWNTFFEGYGSPEDIAALTLFLPFARAVCRALIGAVSLRPAIKDITTLFQESEQETSEDEAAISDERDS
jgi:hypothetical protein